MLPQVTVVRYDEKRNVRYCSSYDHPDYQGTIECNAVLQQTEKHLQSWSYWDTASGGVLWDNQGNVNTEAVK